MKGPHDGVKGSDTVVKCRFKGRATRRKYQIKGPTHRNREKLRLKRVIKKVRKNLCPFKVEILDTPLQKRDKGGRS